MRETQLGAIEVEDSGTLRKTSVEELCFESALLCLEGHFTNSPPMGPSTASKIVKFLNKILEKTHAFKDTREILSKNVEIWLWFCLIFASAVPSLTARSVGPLHDPDRGNDPAESAALISKHYLSLKEDLAILNKLMLIARNLLVTAEPEVPQDICAGVHFDQMVIQTIILCGNVTSKAYETDTYDDPSRVKHNEIVEAYKKLLVTSLQQIHNWTAKNDRNKMAFWLEVLFDDDDPQESPRIDDLSGIRIDIAREQTDRWWQRNWRLCPEAAKLLEQYAHTKSHQPPGELPMFEPLSYNWLPEDIVKRNCNADEANEPETAQDPVWMEDEPNSWLRDKTYRRVSREIDKWWLHARDANYDDWVSPMTTVQAAQARTDQAKAHRLAMVTEDEPLGTSPNTDTAESVGDEEDEDVDEDDDHDDLNDGVHEAEVVARVERVEGAEEVTGVEEVGEVEEVEEIERHELSPADTHGGGDMGPPEEYGAEEGHQAVRSLVQEYVDDMMDDEDEDEYDDGPVPGVLTEIPNILDPKQIEALHMIIKSCILNTVGSGSTRYGENLQRTRCCMMLATDTGKSLVREILVFIAVWEKDDTTVIFQLTAQIVEALHHNALIPYTWNGLKIPKDIISPGQTVLLRLMNYIIRARNMGSTKATPEGIRRDAQACHYLFNFFRTRVVPECVALMNLQTCVRLGEYNQTKYMFTAGPTGTALDPADFPVDTWDMERARDGLYQYLDFINLLSEIPELREYLIKWGAVYELVTLLAALEVAAPKKPLVDPVPSTTTHSPPLAPPPPVHSDPLVERPYATDPQINAQPPPPPPPPIVEAHSFPWGGIKVQILSILAALLQPVDGRSGPGNPIVQDQVMAFQGIGPLLNCCVYDDYNRFARERVQICLKWLMDGCPAANDFIRNLVTNGPPPNISTGGSGSVAELQRADVAMVGTVQGAQIGIDTQAQGQAYARRRANAPSQVEASSQVQSQAHSYGQAEFYERWKATRAQAAQDQGPRSYSAPPLSISPPTASALPPIASAASVERSDSHPSNTITINTTTTTTTSPATTVVGSNNTSHLMGPTLPPILPPSSSPPGNQILPPPNSVLTQSSVLTPPSSVLSKHADAAAVAEYTRHEKLALEQFIARMDEEFSSECGRLAAVAAERGADEQDAVAAAAAQTAIMKDIWNLAGEAARMALDRAAEESDALVRDAAAEVEREAAQREGGTEGSGRLGGEAGGREGGAKEEGAGGMGGEGDGDGQEGGRGHLEEDFM